MEDKKRHLMILGQSKTDCTQQAMPCSELAMIRLELSSNVLVPHAFVSKVLICIISYIMIFWQGRTI